LSQIVCAFGTFLGPSPERVSAPLAGSTRVHAHVDSPSGWMGKFSFDSASRGACHVSIPLIFANRFLNFSALRTEFQQRSNPQASD
jgi:hypothetical protein